MASLLFSFVQYVESEDSVPLRVLFLKFLRRSNQPRMRVIPDFVVDYNWIRHQCSYYFSYESFPDFVDYDDFCNKFYPLMINLLSSSNNDEDFCILINFCLDLLYFVYIYFNCFVNGYSFFLEDIVEVNIEEEYEFEEADFEETREARKLFYFLQPYGVEHVSDIVSEILVVDGRAESEDNASTERKEHQMFRTNEFRNIMQSINATRITGGHKDANIAQLRDERKKRYLASQKQGEFLGEEKISKVYYDNKEKKLNTKLNNLEAYERRVGDKTEITPTCLLLGNKFESLDARLKFFNKNHFCILQEQYKEDKLLKTRSIKCCGNRRPNNIKLINKVYVPFCDHYNKNNLGARREVITNVSTSFKCLNCSQFKCVKIIRRSCSCNVNYCRNCFNTYYNESLICNCVDCLVTLIPKKEIQIGLSYAAAAKKDELDLFFDKKTSKFKKFNTFENKLVDGRSESMMDISYWFKIVKDWIVDSITSVLEASISKIVRKRMEDLVAWFNNLSINIVKYHLEIFTLFNLIWSLLSSNSIALSFSILTNIFLAFNNLYLKYKLILVKPKPSECNTKNADQQTDSDQEYSDCESDISNGIMVAEPTTQQYPSVENYLHFNNIPFDALLQGQVSFGDFEFKHHLSSSQLKDFKFLALTAGYNTPIILTRKGFNKLGELLMERCISEPQNRNVMAALEIYNGFRVNYFSESLDISGVIGKLEKEINEDSRSEAFTLSSLVDFFISMFNIIPNNIRKFFVLSKLRDFNCCTSAYRNGKFMLLELLKFFPKFIREWFNPTLSKDWLKDQLKIKESLYSRVSVSAMAVSLAILSDESKVAISDLKFKANELMRETERELIEHGINLDVNVLRWLKVLKDLINTTTPAKQREKEPFCVRLVGPPGCGKSTYWPVFISPLFSKSSIEKVERELTYCRTPGMDFWDGYNPEKHKIILYDDFGQDAEEAEYLEVIMLISRANFTPNFAGIDTSNPISGVKGQTADPKLVILLSNEEKVTHSISVKSAEAVERRPHLTIRLPGPIDSKPRDVRDLCVAVKSRSIGNDVTKNVWIPLKGYQDIQEYVLKEYRKYLKVNVDMNKTIEEFCYKGAGEDCAGRAEIFEQSFYYSVAESMLGNLLVGFTTGVIAGCFINPVFNVFNAVGHMIAAPIIGYLEVEYETMDIISRAITIMAMFAANQAVFAIAIYILKSYSDGAANKLFELVTSYFDREEKTPVREESGTTVTKQASQIRLVSGKKEDQNRDNIEKKISKNMCVLTMQGKVLTGCFIQGRNLMTVRHMFVNYDETVERDRSLTGDKIPYFKDGTLFTIKFPNGYTCDQIFQKKNLVELYDDGDEFADLVIYQCDTRIPLKNSLLGYLYDGDKVLKDQNIGFITMNPTGGNVIQVLSTVNCDMLTMRYPVGNERWAIAKCFSYNYSTKCGDCGSIIFTDEKQPKIIGMHIGSYKDGDQRFGTAIRVSKQLLENLEGFTSNLEIKEGIAQQLDVVETLEPDERISGGTIKIGVLEGVKLYPIGKTTLRKSPLYENIVEHSTAPSIINIHDKRLNGRDLWLECIAKYSSEPVRMDEKYYDILLDSFEDDFNLTSNIESRVLTLDEAINGNEEIGGLDMSTSPGYPFSLLGKGGAKKKLFDFVDEKYVMKEELSLQYNFLLENFKKGNIPFYPWIDCLKDERRSLEKIALCKTRIFASAPLAYILLQKQYYGAFLQHMNAIRIRTFNRVGMNKDSKEWHDHICKLYEVADEAVDIDYSNKDGNNRIDNIEHFFDSMDRWYSKNRIISEEENNIRRSIREMETHAHHVFYDKRICKWVIYQTIGKVHSGSLITINVNGYTDELDLRLSWLNLAPAELKDIYYYKRFVRTAVVGDDMVLAINNFVRDFYNPEAIVEYLATQGSKLTSGDKSEKLIFKPIYENVFLKNTSRKMYGYWVPTMEIIPMLEPINWIRQSEFMESEDKACEDNCNSVLRNCFWHGGLFNEVRGEILKARPDYNLITFKYLLEHFFEFSTLPDPLSQNQRRSKAL